MTGDWRHGWPFFGDDATEILMGTMPRCSGCGKVHGIICVAIDPSTWEPPGPEPDWPFAEDNCPVCQLLARLEAALDKIPKRLDPRRLP